jgi:hypothetical protein
VVSVWLISSGNPVRDAIVGFLLREDTAYTSGFSEEALGCRAVRFETDVVVTAGDRDACKKIGFEDAVFFERQRGHGDSPMATLIFDSLALFPQ